MPDIRMLALDLDNTLMGPDETISAANITALRACLNQGILVFVVTGRPYSFARMIADRIDSHVGVVAANGGIYESAQGCLERPLSNEALAQVIDRAQPYHIQLFLKGKQAYYCNVPYDPRFLYDHRNEQFSAHLQVHSHVSCSAAELKQQAHDILKILVFHEDAECMQRYRKEMEACPLVTVTDYRPISFDITAAGVDKGSALRALLKQYDLPSSALLACGDGHNDRAMFEAAGFRVAMSNAAQEVKEYCDVTVDNEDFAGVARAVYRYVLTERQCQKSVA